VKRCTPHRLYEALALGTLAIGFAMVALYAYWSFYPYPTMDVPDRPFVIVYPPHAEGTLPKVKQGSFVSYRFTYVKYTDVIPVLQRQFVDGLVFSAGIMPATVLTQGSGVAQVEVGIPRTLPPGVYRLVITRYYRMNPIRTIIDKSQTERFIVEEAQ
jgi:hypothetical protein